jgi:hypothetical protein
VKVSPLPPAPLDEPFTETFTIAGSNPSSDLTGGGVVGAELASTCSAPPASQGTDGWVSTLPESFGDGAHKVAATGSGAAYDLDRTSTTPTASHRQCASSAADESGALPTGTARGHPPTSARRPTSLEAVDTQ